VSVVANVVALLSPTLTREEYLRAVGEVDGRGTPRRIPRLCTQCGQAYACHGGSSCIHCQPISER
jgi:hypothetical protein